LTNTPGSQPAWCPSPPPSEPPQDYKQLVAWEDVAKGICHYGWGPILLTGMLRDWLTRHFTPQNVEDVDLRKLVWQEAASSGIMIESVWRWRPDMTEKRPAVLVKRNAMKNQRFAIADRQGSDKEGNDHYQTFWLGSHTLFCLHQTGAACEILATEVQREFTQHAPYLIKYLHLHKFQVTEVGPVSEVEEAAQNYVVPVTIGWAYIEKWKLALDALPLKAVDFDLHTLIR